MADTKLSALPELATTPASNDEVYIRDESEAAANESKRITIANLLAGGVSDPHGAAQHTDVTRWLFLLANEGYVETGTPAQGPTLFGGVEGGANAGIFVYFTIKVPDDFVSFISMKVVWACGAASGDMLWRLLCYYASSGESYNTHSNAPAYGVTATGGADVINVQEPANALTLSNLAKSDYIGIEFTRLGSDELDTLDEAANFLGLLFTYTAEQ